MSIKKKTTILAALIIFAVFSIAASADTLMSFNINVTDAYEHQPFTVTATVSDPGSDITVMTIEHFNQSDWQPQQCNAGNTCTKSWTFKEEKAGDYTFRIKAKNSLGKIAIDSFTVQVKKHSVPPTSLKVNLRANPRQGEQPLNVRLTCKADGDRNSNNDSYTYTLDSNGQVFYNTTSNKDNIKIRHVFNSGLYNVTCTVTDSEGKTGADSAIVNVTGQPVADLPPFITLIAPADNAVLDTNNVTAQFMAVDDISEAINCSMYAMSDNGIEWQEVFTAFLANATAISTTFENVPDGTYTWNVACADESGNSAFAADNYTVTINSTPIVIPAQCSDGIDNDGDGLIDFPADPGCVNATDSNETDEIIIPPVVDLAPIVSIIAPTDNTIFMDTNNITVQYTVTDDMTQNMSCSVAVVDADGNFQLVGDVHSTMNDTITSIDFTNVPNGVYVWNVLCIDELWNLGYNQLNFTVTFNYTQPVLMQCADGIDNDGDGLIDLADPGCIDANDDNETDEIVCQNNLEISGISISGTDIFDGATVGMFTDGIINIIPFDYNFTNLGLTEITGINYSMSMTSNITGETTSSNNVISIIGPQASFIEGEDFNQIINPIVDGDYHMVLSVEGTDENGCSQDADFDFILRLTTPIVPTQCSDGIDNDGDNLTDLADPGCIDANDDNETDEVLPDIHVTLTANPTEGEEPLDVNFTCEVVGGNSPYNYTIAEIMVNSGGVGMIPDVAENVYEFSRTYDEGIVNVTCSVTDSEGRQASDSVIINVTEAVQPLPQCSDGIDNDGDNLTDFPNDPGCADANDDNETDEIIPPVANDTIAPVVQIIAPQDGEVITSSNVTVQFIASDETSANLTCAVFTINGTEVTQVSEAILTANNTITPIEFTDVPNGQYTWNVACIDEAWNLGMNPTNFTNIVNVTDNSTNGTQNHAPVFDPIDNVVVSESQIVFITPVATDPDGDNVAITASNLPAGATFEMGALFWIPDYTQAGNYTITFTASDGELNASADVLITVLDVPPQQHMSVTLVSDTVSGTAPLDVNFTCSVQNGESPYSYSWIIYDESQLAYNIGFTWPVTDSIFSFNEILGAGNWTASCIVGDSNGTVVTSNNINIILDAQPALAQCSDGIDNDADSLIDSPNDPGCTDANDDNETDEVIPPVANDTIAPVVQIIAPQDGEVITSSNVTVQFIASDETSANLTCAVFTINGTDVQQANDAQIVSNNTITSFDFTNVPNGVYTWNIACIDEEWNLGMNPVNFTNTINYTEPVIVLPACADGIDNDADSLIDFPNDPGCTDANDDNETDEVIPPVANDTIAPVVQIIAPADNTIFTNTNNITAQYIVTDNITQNMTCSIAVVDADGNFQLVGDVHIAMNNTITSVGFTNVPNGVYTWNVLCIDQYWNLGYNPLNFTVTVNYTQPFVNSAPVLDNIADVTANENSTITIIADATDADNDTLTYSVSGLPSGASFNSMTRTFAWTPDFTQSGNYTVIFSVTDSIASDSQAVRITVNDMGNGTDDDQGDDNDDQGNNGGNGGGSGGGNNGHSSDFDCPLNKYRENGKCVSAGGSSGHSQQPASPVSNTASAGGKDNSPIAGILGGQGHDSGKLDEPTGTGLPTGNAVAEPQKESADFGKAFFGITLLIAALACAIVGSYRLYAYRLKRSQIPEIAQIPSQNAF